MLCCAKSSARTILSLVESMVLFCGVFPFKMKQCSKVKCGKLHRQIEIKTILLNFSMTIENRKYCIYFSDDTLLRNYNFFEFSICWNRRISLQSFNSILKIYQNWFVLRALITWKIQNTRKYSVFCFVKEDTNVDFVAL